ncbi:MULTISPECIES: SLC13 family permease [Acinetobacter]|uniref:SLC13 family permease n=1 Tax=Acinetobacter indicus TaxID=756892 RepID=A0AAW8Z1V2_9GAMM|nr:MULTISPECIES: SLC13 family permease [Acinetobacter]MDV4313789.1 SLC13 family permease [Acinetobacter indicus]MDV4315299.1 SLC13 family permease [Acinetobacter indicus]
MFNASLLRFPLWSVIPLLVIYVALAFSAFNLDQVQQNAILTIGVFLTATWLWICTKLEETYIALLAVFALILTGNLNEEHLYQAWGQDLIWLLIAAFVIAAGVFKTGLATYCASQLLKYAHNTRTLCYLLTIFIVLSAFIIPSTSGRAAIILPIFLGLAEILKHQTHILKALALLCPSIILLSAIGSYLGAGAHLITNQILVEQGYPAFSLLSWLWLGFPFALVSSLACTELILGLFTSKKERSMPLNLSHLNVLNEQAVGSEQKLSALQKRIICILVLILGLWLTEPLHHISATMVAIFGALLMVTPSVGCIKFSQAVKTIPWALLMFMAATLAMGAALIESGAIQLLTHSIFSKFDIQHPSASIIFIALMIIISLLSHLFIQSRSARSVVLIPIAISLAPQFQVSPVAMAFISTAAAGFCHSLTSSAKPIAIFHQTETQTMFNAHDLLKLSFYLAPIMLVLLIIFSFIVWPMLGMPLLL